MPASPSDALPAVEALSPVDGRYRAATAPLRALLAESGLIRERIRVEARWLLALAQAVPQLPGATLSAAVRARAQALAESPDESAANAVKTIEARINHDVKAVEYYVREQLAAAGATPATLELVHFGCTSEDLNNLSYARLLLAARALLLAVARAAYRGAGRTRAALRRGADALAHARAAGQPHNLRQGARQLRRAACGA